jgi:hypothetical protein
MYLLALKILNIINSMEVKNIKSRIMFIALYSAAFIFPSIGSVDTEGADTETDISHCANLEATAARPACEAAANRRGAPAEFDDGLMGAPAMGAPGEGRTGGTYVPGTMGNNPAPGTQGKAPRYNQ